MPVRAIDEKTISRGDVTLRLQRLLEDDESAS